SLAGIAALVLLVISHYYFSKFYEKPDIFKNALIGTIVQVAGNIIGGIIITVAVGSALFTVSGDGFDYSNYQDIIGLVFESGLTIFGALIIIAGMIVGLYFVYKALVSLFEQTGIKLFKTAGLLYFIGAIGIIVFFLGFLVILAAWIIHIIAYFSIPLEGETQGATS
ncbi:MAG: DUF996 domain-containing protein, partial [Bacteroidota bacterium]